MAAERSGQEQGEALQGSGAVPSGAAGGPRTTPPRTTCPPESSAPPGLRSAVQRSFRSLAFSCLQLFRNFLQVVFREMPVSYQMLDQRLRGSSEYPVHEFLHHFADHALTRPRRAVHVGAIRAAHLQMS